ncbi:unnamed protein product [Vitrella brassicaformis CCMP3155]|uniref:ZFYVE26-like TPR repeats domain-containing protein n=1 Tax=Vitrella brassicaformis (strain CCMP3155) TaxID=1169540 RepID=A0A0G4GEB4_VITBC|nr:unnamed protein product [Vitrella brassicaformis CCMP3155]|eukprot:CEM27730.1 unnamed protein product [Vitrella brassicaformis CCMP3155]
MSGFEGSRCRFLLEHDDSRLFTVLCNYLSVGQFELARALLHQVAARDLSKALTVLKSIVWHGPPPNWLSSVSVPSSAHLSWLCLIEFSSLVEQRQRKTSARRERAGGSKAKVPGWLHDRVQFDVLLAQTVLDAAAIQAQVVTAEVVCELRAYHASLLCFQAERDLAVGTVAEGDPLAMPRVVTLPAVSLLPLPALLPPTISRFPLQTLERTKQARRFRNGEVLLSKSAIQQLYSLLKTQPHLGHALCSAMAPSSFCEVVPPSPPAASEQRRGKTVSPSAAVGEEIAAEGDGGVDAGRDEPSMPPPVRVSPRDGDGTAGPSLQHLTSGAAFELPPSRTSVLKSTDDSSIDSGRRQPPPPPPRPRPPPYPPASMRAVPERTGLSAPGDATSGFPFGLGRSAPALLMAGRVQLMYMGLTADSLLHHALTRDDAWAYLRFLDISSAALHLVPQNGGPTHTPPPPPPVTNLIPPSSLSSTARQVERPTLSYPPADNGTSKAGGWAPVYELFSILVVAHSDPSTLCGVSSAPALRSRLASLVALPLSAPLSSPPYPASPAAPMPSPVLVRGTPPLQSSYQGPYDASGWDEERLGMVAPGAYGGMDTSAACALISNIFHTSRSPISTRTGGWMDAKVAMGGHPHPHHPHPPLHEHNALEAPDPFESSPLPLAHHPHPGTISLPRTASRLFSKFFHRMMVMRPKRGGRDGAVSDADTDAATEAAEMELDGANAGGDATSVSSDEEGTARWVPSDRSFSYRTRVYEALFAHEDPLHNYTGLRLYCVLEDEFLKLQAAQSPLPPAFELLNRATPTAGAAVPLRPHQQQHGAASDGRSKASAASPTSEGSHAPLPHGPPSHTTTPTSTRASVTSGTGGPTAGGSAGVGVGVGGGLHVYIPGSGSISFEEPSCPFWDAYFEFTRVAHQHCLEYAVTTAVRFIKKRHFQASACLLAPFPQLKPLVILLCWPEFHGDVAARQTLLDVLWKSYCADTTEAPLKTGDLLVDHHVEVLDYQVAATWWISRLVSQQRGVSAAGAGAGETPSDKGGDPFRITTASSLPGIAADVLQQVTAQSILAVMQTLLPAVSSSRLISALDNLPPLRQPRARLEHSYDLDLAKTYYALRCAIALVERCMSASPSRVVIEESLGELHRLLSSLNRTPFKLSLLLHLCSLCVARKRHMRGSGAAGPTGARDFLVPPNVVISIMTLVRVHVLQLVSAEQRSGGRGGDGPGRLQRIMTQLRVFIQEALWRAFICLKDYFAFSALAHPSHGDLSLISADSITSAAGSQGSGGSGKGPTSPPQPHAGIEAPRATDHLAAPSPLTPTSPRPPDSSLIEGAVGVLDEMSWMGLGSGEWRQWAPRVGAVLFETHMEARWHGVTTGAKAHDGASEGSDESAQRPSGRERVVVRGGMQSQPPHPFMRFCTPPEVPISLAPSSFIPRMLAEPSVLLNRALKINDYVLSMQLVDYFGLPAVCRSTVTIAERFAALRGRVAALKTAAVRDEGDGGSGGDLDFGGVKRGIDEILGVCERDGLDDMVLSGNASLLAFYACVDLAVSAAANADLSMTLLKCASAYLSAHRSRSQQSSPSPTPTTAPLPDGLYAFFTNLIDRLSVLLEAKGRFDHTSGSKAETATTSGLAALMLDVETLPTEPALLRTHLSRVQSQRNALLSLVESVDLLKKGHTSASHRSLMDFLSSAIKTLASERPDESPDGGGQPGGGDAVEISQQADNAFDQERRGESGPRYLLGFLEYLTKVAEWLRSASQASMARGKSGDAATATEEANEAKGEMEGEGGGAAAGAASAAASSSRDGGVGVSGGTLSVLGSAMQSEEWLDYFSVLAKTPKATVARVLFELHGHREALQLADVMGVDLVEVILKSSLPLSLLYQTPTPSHQQQQLLPTSPADTDSAAHGSASDEGSASDADSGGGDASRYPLSMELVLYLGELEGPLPDVKVPSAPLLATIACLERWNHRWPSRDFLTFAQEQSKVFPCIYRWIEERNEAWRAICETARATQDETADDSSDSLSFSVAELQTLAQPQRAALRAVADDAEASLVSCYTERVLSLLSQTPPQYQHALRIIDEHLPLHSPLSDRTLHSMLVQQEAPGNGCAGGGVGSMEDDLRVFESLYRLKDKTLAARLALTKYREWDADTAIQTLTMCLQSLDADDRTATTTGKSDTSPDAQQLSPSPAEDHPSSVSPVSPDDGGPSAPVAGKSLRKQVRQILKKMVTFKKILDVPGGRWRVWQEIERECGGGCGADERGSATGEVPVTPTTAVSVSSSSPLGGLVGDARGIGEVINTLVDLKQHDLARALTKMYRLTDPIPSLELSYLLHLFTTLNDKTAAVKRLLSFSPQLAVSFVFQMLHSLDRIQHRILLCRLLLSKLNAWLTKEQVRQLQVLNASMQLLGKVSDTVRPHFLSLLDRPLLIVESLLMNARVDLLRPFLEDFPEFRQDSLILRYGRKALGLPPEPHTADTPTHDDDDTVVSPAAAAASSPASVHHGGSDEGEGGLGGQWCLTGDGASDAHLRRIHVFEDAPSAALAESILDLCSSERSQNADSCFQICDELSLCVHRLVPRHPVHPGVASPSPSHPPQPASASPLHCHTTVNTSAGGRSLYGRYLDMCGGGGRKIGTPGGVSMAVGAGSCHGGREREEETAGAPVSPSTSVAVVLYMIRRLLNFLRHKFVVVSGMAYKMDRSLRVLDFIPRLWQRAGRRVGLAQLADPRQASLVRDQLIREDHLALSLELCQRCRGKDRDDDNNGGGAGAQGGRGKVADKGRQGGEWASSGGRHVVSEDPVRQAKAVGLLMLQRSDDAKRELEGTVLSPASQRHPPTTEGTAGDETTDGEGGGLMSPGPSSPPAASVASMGSGSVSGRLGRKGGPSECDVLTSLEWAIRHPPIYDLRSLRQLHRLLTFNTLHHKLFGRTPLLAPLPLQLYPRRPSHPSCPHPFARRPPQEGQGEWTTGDDEREHAGEEEGVEVEVDTLDRVDVRRDLRDRALPIAASRSLPRTIIYLYPSVHPSKLPSFPPRLRSLLNRQMAEQVEGEGEEVAPSQAGEEETKTPSAAESTQAAVADSSSQPSEALAKTPIGTRTPTLEKSLTPSASSDNLTIQATTATPGSPTRRTRALGVVPIERPTTLSPAAKPMTADDEGESGKAASPSSPVKASAVPERDLTMGMMGPSPAAPLGWVYMYVDRDGQTHREELITYPKLTRDVSYVAVGVMRGGGGGGGGKQTMAPSKDRAMPFAVVPSNRVPRLVRCRLSPRLLTEALEYHKKYGDAASLLDLLIREGQLDRAIQMVFLQDLPDELFIDVVAHYALAHNRMLEVQTVISNLLARPPPTGPSRAIVLPEGQATATTTTTSTMHQPGPLSQAPPIPSGELASAAPPPSHAYGQAVNPMMAKLERTMRALKGYLRQREALELLYGYQVFTRDYVNAAIVAVQLFMTSTCWDARFGHLHNAFSHLSAALQLIRRSYERASRPLGGPPGAGVSVGVEGAPSAPPRASSPDGHGINFNATSDIPIQQLTENDVLRGLRTLKLQMEVCETLPNLPPRINLFGPRSVQAEVCDKLMTTSSGSTGSRGASTLAPHTPPAATTTTTTDMPTLPQSPSQYELANRVMDFFGLPKGELYVKASNIIAAEAKSLDQVKVFLSAVSNRLPAFEWDALVVNIINIWVVEHRHKDPTQVQLAAQLVHLIQDDRHRLDAYVLLGQLGLAFHLACRLGSLQDLLHIRDEASRAGEQSLVAQVHAFLSQHHAE